MTRTVSISIPVLNISIPVEAIVIFLIHLYTGRPFIDSKFNFAQIRIGFDFISLLYSQISGIAVSDMVIFAKQFRRFLNVMYIGSSSCYRK